MNQENKNQKIHRHSMPEVSDAERAPRILLAEDDDEMRSLLMQALGTHGYQITDCSNGFTLLKHLDSFLLGGQTEVFDLIISDVRMPGFTGLEVLEGLREFEDAPPMILITAFGDPETHALGKRLGAAAMIDKPFAIEALLSIVDDIVFNRSVQDIRRSLSPGKRVRPIVFPLNIVFRRVSSSERVEAFVRKKAAKLNRFRDKIQECQVVIEAPHQHHRHGPPYHVRIILTIAGKEFVAGHDPGEPVGRQNPYAAISDSFNAVYHQMESYLDRNKKHGNQAGDYRYRENNDDFIWKEGTGDQ